MTKMTKKPKNCTEVDGIVLGGTKLRILGLLVSSQLSQRDISRELGLAESTINQHLEELDSQGYIDALKNTKPKYPSITDNGRRALSMRQCVSLGELMVELHDLQLTAPILRKPKKWNFDKPVFKNVSDYLRQRGWSVRGDWKNDYFMISNHSGVNPLKWTGS